MSEKAVMEGFICPLCRRDMGDFSLLRMHWEEYHPDDDFALLQSLKAIVGKAKRKILNQDSESSQSSNEDRGAYRSRGYDPSSYEDQDIGACRRHTALFKKIRDVRTDRYAAETNKLIIRLNKLLHDVPMEPSKRKAHEQSVVPWLDDSSVKLCPECARSFGVTRRKHHCRLCGGIMCQSCSFFLPVATARQLASIGGCKEEGSEKISKGVIRRFSSTGSLNTLMGLMQDETTHEPHVRICVHCTKLLERREEQVCTRKTPAALTELYSRLSESQSEATELLPRYRDMVLSLSRGEMQYELSQAQERRIRLLRLAEEVDSASKQIADLETDSPKTIQLQRKIRMRATHFLKENMIGLPELPNEDQLLQLQKTHRSAAERRVEMEKQRAIEYMQRKMNTQQPSPSLSRQRREVSLGAGWGPGNQETSMFESDDPLAQQIKIIQNYLRQAREAGKMDEVVMLEQNLEELKEEYQRQRR